MAVVDVSAVATAGPWVLGSLGLVLAYKVVVIILVRSSKHDIVVRDRWTGLWVRRGRSDGAPSQTERRPRRALRSVDEPTPGTDPPARSG